MPPRDKAPEEDRSIGTTRGESGTLLVVAVVIAFLMTMLGVAFSALAEDESRIAQNNMRGNQALYAAEGVARCVRGWFEIPDPAAGFLVPGAGDVDRSLRRVDPDGDGVHSPWSSAVEPWNVIYRQGTDDLFERPFQGSPSLSLEGDERGPDLRIANDGSPAERAFLANLEQMLYPAFPSPRERARIVRIDVRAPPRVLLAGRIVRLGSATISVTVAIIEEGPSGGRERAVRTVRCVLAEAPYREAAGALLAGGDADLREGIEVRWGLAAARRDVLLPGPSSTTAPSGWPRRSHRGLLVPDADRDGTREDTDLDGTADWDEWWGLADRTLEDPWFFASAGSRLSGAPPAGAEDHLPWPFDPAGLPTGPGGPYDPDEDRSNLLQSASVDAVPGISYELWRMAAESGFRNCHYYAFDPASGAWREDGGGPVTHPSAAAAFVPGLHFFDTADGRPPEDATGDGTPDNLAPDVTLGTGWWGCGVLFLGARSVGFEGIGWQGPERSVSPPGEPCADADGDGRCGAGELFLDLSYPADPLAEGSAFTRVAAGDAASGFVRQEAGPAHSTPLAFEGLLVVAGDLRTGGDANLRGALLAGGAVRSGSAPGGPAGLLRVLADPGMAAGTAPATRTGAPRTIVASWQVERAPDRSGAP